MKRRQLAPTDPENTLAWAQRMRKRLTDIHLQQQRLDKERHEIVIALWGLPKPVFEETFAPEILCPWSHARAEAETQWAELHGFLGPTKKERDEEEKKEKNGMKTGESEKNDTSRGQGGESMRPGESCSGQGTGPSANSAAVAEEGGRKDGQGNDVRNVVQGNGQEEGGSVAASGDTGIRSEGGVNPHPSSSSSSFTEPHSHGLKSLPTCDDDDGNVASSATLIRPRDYDKNCNMNDQPTGGNGLKTPPEVSPTASDRSENATCPTTILTPSSLRERLESRRVLRTASTLTSIGSDVGAADAAPTSKRQLSPPLNGSRSFRCVDDSSVLERGMCKARVIGSKEGDNDGEKDLGCDNLDDGKLMTVSMENKPQLDQPPHINTACDSSLIDNKNNNYNNNNNKNDNKNNNNNNSIFPEYPLGGNEDRDTPPIILDAQGTIRLPSIGSPNNRCGMENNEKITMNFHDDENVKSIPECGEPFKKEKEIDLKKTHGAEHGGTTILQANGIVVDQGFGGRKRPSFHTKKTVPFGDEESAEDVDSGGRSRPVVSRSGVGLHTAGLQTHERSSTSRKTLSPRHHDHYQIQQQQQPHTTSSSSTSPVPGKVRRKSGPLVKGGAASLLATKFKNATAASASTGDHAALEEEEIDLTDAPTYVSRPKPESPRSPFVGDNDDTISQELDFLTQVPSTLESEHDDEVNKEQTARRSLARTLVDEGEARTPPNIDVDDDETAGEVEQKSPVNAENPISVGPVHRDDGRSSRVSIASTLIDPGEARELRDGEILPHEYEQQEKPPPIIQHSSRVSVATTLVYTQQSSTGGAGQPYDCLTQNTCNQEEKEGDQKCRLPQNLESPYTNMTMRRTSDVAHERSSNCKVDDADNDDDPSPMERSDAVRRMSLRHSKSGHTTEQRCKNAVVDVEKRKRDHIDNDSDKEDSESSELVPMSLETQEERTPGSKRITSTPSPDRVTPGMRHQVKDEAMTTSESKRRRTRSPIMTISDEEDECVVNEDNTENKAAEAATAATATTAAAEAAAAAAATAAAAAATAGATSRPFSRSPSSKPELKHSEEEESTTIRALRTPSPSREREKKVGDKNAQNNNLLRDDHRNASGGMDRPRFRLSRSSTSPLVSRKSMVNGLGPSGDAKSPIVTDRKNVISIDLSSSSDEEKEKPALKKKEVASGGKPAPAARVSAAAADAPGAPAAAPDVRMPMRGNAAPSIASQDALHHPTTQSAPSNKPPPSNRSSQGNLMGTSADSNSRLAVDPQRRPPVVQARRSVAMAPMPIESTAFGRLPYEFFASLSSAGMKDYLKYFGMKVTGMSEKEQRKQLYDNIKYLTDGVMPASLVPLPDRVDEKQLEEEREIIQAIRRTPHWVQVLTFDPVDLYDLQAHLKEGGVRIDLNSLRLLLESKGVAIRLQGKDDRRY